MATVAIIGGGIAGLTAAYTLHRAGADVTVFERRERVGGVIVSERTDGYLVEHGPNSLQSGAAVVDGLIERLGLEEAYVEANPSAGRRYVVRGGRPVALPGSPPGFFTSELFTLRAKLRLFREPFVPRGTAGAEESIADFVRRRLGPELLDYAIDPFVAGVYAGDPETLAVGHAFPRLFALEQEYGSLIRGAIRRTTQGKSGSPVPKRRLFSFRDGLHMLPAALAGALEGRLRTGHTVTALRPAGSRWEIDTRPDGGSGPFDGVVLTVPLHGLDDIDLGGVLDPAPLRDVYYPPVSVVALGFRREDVGHPLDGFGMLVPAAEARFRILGTLFSSTLFPGRAPEGRVLLTTFVGGARHPELGGAQTEALVRIVREDLQVLLEVAGEPEFVRHVAWPKAIPQYTVGYGAVKAYLDRAEAAHPGLVLAGSYRQGISVGDAAASGEAAAHRLLDRL